MNKKGVIGIIIFFLVLFTILIVGFIGAMFVSVISFTSDELTPIMEDLGVVGNTNLSEAGEITFGTLETFINSFSWMMGFLYVVALIFSVIFAISINNNPHPVFVGFYFFLMILLIFGAIIMSNMYENIYTGTDIVATGLQDQALLSYMILYSPFILSLIAFIVGIYLFAIKPEDGGGI